MIFPSITSKMTAHGYSFSVSVSVKLSDPADSGNAQILPVWLPCTASWLPTFKNLVRGKNKSELQTELSRIQRLLWHRLRSARTEWNYNCFSCIGPLEKGTNLEEVCFQHTVFIYFYFFKKKKALNTNISDFYGSFSWWLEKKWFPRDFIDEIFIVQIGAPSCFSMKEILSKQVLIRHKNSTRWYLFIQQSCWNIPAQLKQFMNIVWGEGKSEVYRRRRQNKS